jgi:hypothetical protein
VVAESIRSRRNGGPFLCVEKFPAGRAGYALHEYALHEYARCDLPAQTQVISIRSLGKRKKPEVFRASERPVPHGDLLVKVSFPGRRCPPVTTRNGRTRSLGRVGVNDRRRGRGCCRAHGEGILKALDAPRHSPLQMGPEIV